MRSFPLGVLPALASLWLLMLCAAPASLRHGIAPAATIAVYQAGSLLCHQRADRSFRAAGIQMPVCGRCLGLYASAAFGAIAALIIRRRGPFVTRAPVVAFVVSVAAVPMVLSLFLEWTGAVQGSNASRFASALPLGVVMGWFVQLIATAGQKTSPRRVHAI